MFKNSTIIKAVTMLNKSIEYYKMLNPDEFKTCISKGNVKIGRVMNFSIAPIITCGHACAHCRGFCYDVKAVIQYPNSVVNARARNTVFAMYHRDRLFNEIDKAMSRRRTNKFFRWHVAGDILDLDYFARMVGNARKHGDFTIWTYTKQYHIVNEYCNVYGRNSIPSNFHIMFSKWDGLAMNNPYNFPVFNCKLKDGNKDTPSEWFKNTYQCPGNCDICKACGRGCVAGESAWCNEH